MVTGWSERSTVVEADIVAVLAEVVVRELEYGFHHLIEGFLGILEKFRVAPAEDGAVAALGRGGKQPVWLKALV
jgi:hypothetical protein